MDDQPISSAELRVLSARALGVADRSRSVPRWLCRLLLGPVLTDYATAHTNLSNGKLKGLGFQYLYPTCEVGLPQVVAEWKRKRPHDG